jgi:hypothetical protein
MITQEILSERSSVVKAYLQQESASLRQSSEIIVHTYPTLEQEGIS